MSAGRKRASGRWCLKRWLRSADGGRGGVRPGNRNQPRRAQHGDPRDRSAQGNPLAFPVTCGQAADCRAVEAFLDSLQAICVGHADRASNSNRIRHLIERQGVSPTSYPMPRPALENCISRSLYKRRNAIEQIFCRLRGCDTCAVLAGHPLGQDVRGSGLHSPLCPPRPRRGTQICTRRGVAGGGRLRPTRQLRQRSRVTRA